MLPKVDFFGKQITRLIMGDNPVNGHSYIPEIYSSEEMLDYYTAENAVKAMFEAEKLGINACMPLANDFTLRVIRQYRNEGGLMQVIFQPYPAIDFDVNIRMMQMANPLAIYHRGTDTDILYEMGKTDELLDNLKKLKDTGLPIGLGTHVPEVVMRAEDEDWGADFYVTCLYNARRENKGTKSGFITGKSKHSIFHLEDRFLMFDVINKVQKQCIAFKMFAGGQIFYNKKEAEYKQTAQKFIKETYDNIKANDIACMGVYQKHKNQIKENIDIVKNIL